MAVGSSVVTEGGQVGNGIHEAQLLGEIDSLLAAIGPFQQLRRAASDPNQVTVCRLLWRLQHSKGWIGGNSGIG